MTITSFADLEKWYLDPKGQEEAPHWNLYGLNYGKTDQVLHRNLNITDLREGARHLEEVIRWLSPRDGSPARFRLSVFPPGKHNNPTAVVEVQIRENVAPASGPVVAGIGGLPPGVGSVEAYVDQRIKMAELEWENRLLKEQLNAPANTWERMAETISGVPGIDKVLQALAVGLVSRINPAAMPAVQAAMNGTPSAVSGEHEEDDEEQDQNAVFMYNINAASNTLGTDPVTLSKKLNKLIQENPELAKSMIQ